ncbi:MAG: type IVB secretion system protein IcmH/DotU [Pseudomonadota bacterium]|nr:type IVB secretion system protein IcmH/DotU [Pseudomonadota bacterium]
MGKILEISPEKYDQPQTNKTHSFKSHQYQSELMTSKIGTNKILQAAGPIINYVTHVCNSNNKYRKNSVSAILKKEINFFMAYLEPYYKQEIIFAARHIICSWSNEIIINSDWGRKKKWSTPLSKGENVPESWKGENFFVIVQRCASNPKEYQDLLQLCYCCMTLGYAGIYRDDKKGHVACYTIIDILWDLIASEVNKNTHLTQVKTGYVNSNKPKVIWSLMLAVTIICIGTILTLELQLMRVTKPMLTYLEKTVQVQQHDSKDARE